MKYFLHGGKNEIAGLIDPKFISWLHSACVTNMLFIPFAISESQWQKRWEQVNQFIDLGKIEVSALTLTNLDRKRDELIHSADGIYLPGGSQTVLLNRLKSTAVWADIMQKADTIKVIGGGSAGEMALGEKTLVGRHQVSKIVDGLSVFKNCILDSHFSKRDRQPRLLAALEQQNNMYGIGIDEDTMVLFDEDQKVEKVIGKGRAYKIDINKKVTVL